MRLRARVKKLERVFGIGRKRDLLPLILISEYVKGERDSDGNVTRILEPASGSVDSQGKRYFRLPGESVEQFKDRLIALSSPKDGSPRQISLYPPDAPPAA